MSSPIPTSFLLTHTGSSEQLRLQNSLLGNISIAHLAQRGKGCSVSGGEVMRWGIPRVWTQTTLVPDCTVHR